MKQLTLIVMIVCLYSTITQTASVNQNIRMTWDLNWDIIVNITNDVFIIGPICQNYFISSIQNCRSNFSIIKIKVKTTVISNDIQCQVKIALSQL